MNNYWRKGDWCYYGEYGTVAQYAGGLNTVFMYGQNLTIDTRRLRVRLVRRVYSL